MRRTGRKANMGCCCSPVKSCFCSMIPGFTCLRSKRQPGFPVPSGSQPVTVSVIGSTGRSPAVCFHASPIFRYLPRRTDGSRETFPAVIADPRAAAVCPLVAHGENHVEESFCEAVSLAAAALLSCPKHRRFLEMLSAVSDEYLRFLK